MRGPQKEFWRQAPVPCHEKPGCEVLPGRKPAEDTACGPMLGPEATPYLVSLLGPQEMARHVLRQHVGDQGLVPAPHLVDTFLLVVDLDLP